MNIIEFTPKTWFSGISVKCTGIILSKNSHRRMKKFLVKRSGSSCNQNFDFLQDKYIF